MVQGTVARRAALEILRRVRAGQTFDQALSEALDDVEGPDRRLAHEVSAGVLRSRTELDRCLQRLVSGNWEQTAPDLKDLLRIGAYQLTRLERVPPHAAVQTTVEVAKRSSGKGAAGLVNAVLRRIAKGDVPAPSKRHGSRCDRLAEEFSHPKWLVKRWEERFGVDRTRALLEHNNRKPQIVVYPIGWSQEQLADRLNAHHINWTPAPYGRGLVVDEVRVEDLPGYHEGAFVVQDSGQSRMLEHAGIPEGALVWDSCAAPGGKAAVLSRRGPVVASDLRRRRLGRLMETLGRVAPDVPVVVADAKKPPFAPERIDVTLVDAPCSATGTLRRHPDGRWRLTEQMVAEAARTQASILNGASGAVHVGALLVYMTCSLEPEENEEVIESFLREHPEFSRDGEDLRVFPPDAGTDGGFVSRLRRQS